MTDVTRAVDATAGPNDAPPLLEIVGLQVSIGSAHVLRGVDLRVSPGQAVAIVGETGSGKSITVKTATGLLRRSGGTITAGTVSLAGDDVTSASAKAWRAHQGRTFALVPQNSMSSLDPLTSVGTVLRRTVRRVSPAADARAETKRVLSLTQLEPTARLLRSYPHELSGGMRQRVMIALALACRPQLLVADEPTTALDVAVQREIVDLLSRLRAELGLGLLLVSHDLALVADATQAIVVMYAGQTIEAGPTAQVLGDPGHPYTKALLEARPERGIPGQPLHALAGRPPTPVQQPQPGCSFASRCPVPIEACSHQTPPPVATHDRRISCIRFNELRNLETL